MKDVEAACYVRLVFSGGVAPNTEIQTVAFIIYSCRTKPWQKEQIRHRAKSNRVTVIKEAKCVSVRSGFENENSNGSIPAEFPNLPADAIVLAQQPWLLAASDASASDRGACVPSRRRRTLSSVYIEMHHRGKPPRGTEVAACILLHRSLQSLRLLLSGLAVRESTRATYQGTMSDVCSRAQQILWGI